MITETSSSSSKIYAAMEMEMEKRALEEKVLKTNVSDRSSALFNLPVYDLLGLSVDMDAIEVVTPLLLVKTQR